MHASLCRDGDEIFAVSQSINEDFAETMLSAPLPTMSYSIDFDSEEEVHKAYSMLAEGGHVLRPLGALPWTPCSADVVDQYGVYWYIYIPEHGLNN